MRVIQRRPAFLASGGLLVLVLLAAPALSLHLGTANAGTDPQGSTTRIAYDLTSKGFGPGVNGPVLVVADTSGASPGGAAELRRALAHQPGVASVAAPQLSPDGQVALLNLLSAGAAYGVLVAVFEWGWGASAIGATVAPIARWVPPMLFAIVFGLSMDYEVFLLGAIREARAQVGDGAAAVAAGLGRTARVISAAAVIRALVFGSFVTSNELSLKVIGLGLAAAVVVDATVIRLVVVPALLTLLGPAAWWRPGRRGAPRPPIFRAAPVGLDAAPPESRPVPAGHLASGRAGSRR